MLANQTAFRFVNPVYILNNSRREVIKISFDKQDLLDYISNY